MSARATRANDAGCARLIAPFAIFFAVFMLAPLAYGLALSFLDWEMLTSRKPTYAGLANYREALGDEYFWMALQATVTFAALAVPLIVGVALLLALGLDLLPARRQNILRAIYFLPVMISISVAGILWRWFLNSEFGMVNGLLEPLGVKIPWLTEPAWAMGSIVLMTLWWRLGIPVVILLAAMQNIPHARYEAAILDGAGAWSRLRHITLPGIRPVLLFVVLTQLIAAFQVFGQTYLVTGGGPQRSTRVMVQYLFETAFGNYRMGYGATLSWLLFLVTGLLSLVVVRLMRERER